MLRWNHRIIALSLFLNYIIEALSRKSIIEPFGYAIKSPMVFLYNTIIIGLTFTLIYLTRRKIFLASIIVLGWIGAGITNSVLLSFRTTPFTASDLRLFKYGFNLVTTYMNWFQIILVLIAVVAAIILLGYLWKRAPIDTKLFSRSVSIATVVGCTFVVLGITKLGVATGVLAVNFGNIGFAYRDYGFPYCFTNTLLNTGIDKPEEYTLEAVSEIAETSILTEETKPALLEEKKKPNIIMIQLESFFDPMSVSGVTFSEDPIPNFRKLLNDYPSGYLDVPSVGAGTANTEFEIISGMNLDFFGPGEYPYKTILQKTVCESIGYDLKDLGYTAHAIHNNEGTFYSRNEVFAQLGFDTFTPIEYMYQIETNPIGWAKDDILKGEIEKALNSTTDSDFIYAISVQGHGAYPTEPVSAHSRITVDGLEDEGITNGFEYYCNQLYEMDQFIGDLIALLNERGEECVIVMYGDHLPSFGLAPEDLKNNSVYQTQYVVWNNIDLPNEKLDLEAYQLTSQVLNLVGIHKGTMIRFHQNYLEKGGNEETYLTDMKVLEYDMLYGERDIYNGNSPYEPTDIQMGILPIEIEKVVYENNNLYIYGENFNQYSKIYINDKTIETTYMRSDLVIGKEVQLDRDEKPFISIRQVGKDKVPLSSVDFDGVIK